MIILFLSRWFPVPTDNGAKLRIYHLLKGLASQNEVHLLSFADDPARIQYDGLEVICRTVRVVQWHEFHPNSLRALSGLFSVEPRSLIDTYSAEMEIEIRQALSEHDFDLVIPSQWQMTVYRHIFADLPTLFEEIEIGVPYGQFKNTAGLAHIRTGLTWLKQRHFLRMLLENGHPCTVVSEKERALLISIAPHSLITVIPNGVSVEDYCNVNEEPQPNSLIFTGSFRYRPNYEAMVWFVEEILPLIQEQIPETRLTITGDSAGLNLPKHPGVIQTGYVDDVHSMIARSWCSIVPLQVGGGTRLKILEAMALGTPVISTSKGAEGLTVQDGKHLEIDDSAEGFAKKTITLLRDTALRQHLAGCGRQLVRERYDWQVILPEFLTLVKQTAASFA